MHIAASADPRLWPPPAGAGGGLHMRERPSPLRRPVGAGMARRHGAPRTPPPPPTAVAWMAPGPSRHLHPCTHPPLAASRAGPRRRGRAVRALPSRAPSPPLPPPPVIRRPATPRTGDRPGGTSPPPPARRPPWRACPTAARSPCSCRARCRTRQPCRAAGTPRRGAP